MKFKQKGQTIVEFALVLPIFCLFLFGIFYAGMFMADYATLNHYARNLARADVVGQTLTEKPTLMLKNWYDFSGAVNEGAATVKVTFKGTDSSLLKEILPAGYEINFTMYKG